MLTAALALTGWGAGRWAAAAENALPPERTFSNAPFIHKIYLRDEEGTPINSPPKPGPDGKTADDPGKAMSQYTTCGKCHSDKDAMYGGWHSNASDPRAPKGRPGEPWILTDLQTRTHLPLSYRKWPGTYAPREVGVTDFQFAMAFGRHLPGGDTAVTQSPDLRFKMSGKMELDCLVCHTTDSGYDPVDRATQFGDDFQNFKWASNYAAGLGRVVGAAAKLKETWDPSDPNARPAPKIAFKGERFDSENRVLFNVARRVPNERCYFCHTSLDAGPLTGAERPGAQPATQSAAKEPKGGVAFRQNLEGRWRHDKDIHLVKGMMCVDCHRNGADHMTTRGYEGEYADRVKAYGADKVDKSIMTLSCVGCHYGVDGATGVVAETGVPNVQDRGAPTGLGGRNAAPRPAHKGLPTLHFEKIACTTCHSGPLPSDATTMVQTSMAHRLGLPHHRHVDDAAPVIQEPVFLRVDPSGNRVADDVVGGKITPHKVLYPSFWGRLSGDTITPIAPEQVLVLVGKSGVPKLFEGAQDTKEVEEQKPLEPDRVGGVLWKMALYLPPVVKVADAPKTTVSPTTSTASTRPATTQPTAVAAPPTPAWLTGEPIYVTGGKVYRRNPGNSVFGDDEAAIEAFDHDAAKPYAWALAHDVRGAQQALGARGCTDCHAKGTPVFDSVVSTASLIPAASMSQPMHEVRGDSMGALSAFAVTYPMRPILVATGHACALILLLVLLNYGTRAVSRIGRGK